MTTLTYSLLNRFRPEEVLSAATAVQEIRSSLDHGEYANMIKSTATSEEEQNRLKYSVLVNSLGNLAATGDNSLSAMSQGILTDIL